MASDRYAEFLPAISKCIQETLDANADKAKSVASFQFPRLPRYFSEQLLTTTSVVITDHLPRPPLSAWGLSEFASFEQQPMNAITYLDTYFVKTSAAADESLHFHELIHVIQWQVLGPKNFLLLYADGLTKRGYLECPLEAIAYGHQRRFDVEWPSYSVEAEVRKQTLELLNN
jgi:hypothetical protein